MIKPHFGFLLGLCVVVITGCQPIIGAFQVKHRLPIQAVRTIDVDQPGCMRGRDSQCQSPQRENTFAQLPPGQYPAELTLNDKDVIRLKVKNAAPFDLLLEVEIPAETTLPARTGSFTVSAIESGQIFDLRGNVDTVHSRSSTQVGWESCQRQVLHATCGYGKKRSCGHHYITVYGERPVTYHYEIETKNVWLALVSADRAQELATFAGSQTHHYKIYEDIGYCHYAHPIAGYY